MIVKKRMTERVKAKRPEFIFFFFFFFPKDVCLFWTNLFCESVFTAPSQETQDTVNKIKIKIIKEKKDSFPLKLLIVS